MLKDWCDDNEIIFVNLFIHLKNENDDFLNPEFTYDGLHLNGSGYQKWANVIRPLIK